MNNDSKDRKSLTARKSTDNNLTKNNNKLAKPLSKMAVALIEYFPKSTDKQSTNLSNASMVYGIGASALIVISLFFFIAGMWGRAFMILLPALCFLGFALHFMKPTK